jgi:hypothetical protein
MTLDDVILEALQAGPGSLQDIQGRLSKRVYAALERLAKADKVIKEGFEGKGNPKTYSLPKPAPIRRRA